MKANPGGQIPPEHIVGRDALIATYWRILEGQCIYVNDLRRIGKTQIMVKMHANPAPGWVCIHRDVSGCHTAAEFAARVFSDAFAQLGAGKKAFRKMEQLAGKLTEIGIAGTISLKGTSTIAPWKQVLENTFSDIDQAMKEGDTRMVFFWDEIPFLLANIAKGKGPDDTEARRTAMEVLDAIRALSQQYDRVRLFLTGSIGLHHVMDDLHGQGYNGSPLNRMSHEQPGPLDEVEAEKLATSLLLGEGLKSSTGLRELGLHVAQETGGMPFYIHRLVSRLPKGTDLTRDLISGVLLAELSSSTSGWDLEHYDRRLSTYYGANEKTVRIILDHISKHEPQTFQEISQAIKAKSTTGPDDDELRALLDRICKDHYLRKDFQGYSFYLSIVRRWWIIFRSL